jgi:hypothetical protein
MPLTMRPTGPASSIRQMFHGTASPMRPNFALLDVGRPEVATLVAAMLQARDAVSRRSWSNPQEPTSEEWWGDVLADPRARRREQRASDLPLRPAFYALTDEKRETIIVACTKCDWKAAFQRDELIISHGRDYPMPNLLDHLAAPGFGHWVSLMTGGAIALALVLYERITGADVAPSIYWAIAAFTVLAATFKAWQEEYVGRQTVQEQVNQGLNDREKRLTIRVELAKLMSEGQALEQGYDSGRRPTEEQAKQWAARVEQYLRTTLDDSFVVRFQDQSSDDGLGRGLISTEPQPD